MNKYITEFIGTFFLVIMIGLSGAAGPLAPVAIGVMLMVMIYAGGHISGAHYNPAVTLGVFMRGKCSSSDVPMYMAAQVLGAVAAALATAFLFADMGAGASAIATDDNGMVKALLGEFLGTFALVYVVLNVATSKGTEGNSFYGLAIGLTVTACAYAFGGFSGGAFNPAVAVGASTMGGFAWADIWVYLVANFGAAAVAAIVFKMTDSHNAE